MMFMLEVRETAQKSCRLAVLQSVYAHYFFIQLTSDLVHSDIGRAPQGTTFPLLHMKPSDSVSSFDTLTSAYPHPAGGMHAQRMCTSVVQRWLQNPCFILLIPVFPERTEEVFTVAYSCVTLSTDQYSFTCK